MKWSNKHKLMFVGVAAAIVFGNSSTRAYIIRSEPTSVGPPVFQGSDPQGCDFSADGLELYFASTRPGGYGSWDVWVAKRDSLNDPWQDPVNLGSRVNNSQGQVYPAISPDGLEIYFDLWQQPYLYVAKRASIEEPWSVPEKVILFADDTLNRYSQLADVSADGLSLYFSTLKTSNGPLNIWVAHRVSPADPWSEPVELGLAETGAPQPGFPSITADGLTLVFGADQSSWLLASTRSSVEDDWGSPLDLGFESLPNGYDAAISPDGSTLYIDVFPNDLVEVKFTPMVDFNQDEMVDIGDLLIMIDNWGLMELSCDIAPLPLGDGIVNEKDLEMLMRYWGQEQYDPTLMAYWRLDEPEGSFAYDSAGEFAGTVHGEALWKPEDGIVGGALEFDGIDDYVSTSGFVLPTNKSYSVFAWIKGGMPGQVIVSQKGRSDWLLADVTNGSLMTELTFFLRPSQGLQSQTVITDGNWRRVGLAWDGSNRILYVDDVEVASDIYDEAVLSGELHIGAGNNLDPGTFWSGLIDDVRVYNRAVSP